jgi:hypothetical protein
MKKLFIILITSLFAFSTTSAITIKWKMAAGSTISDCVMYCWTGGNPNVEPAGTWNSPNTSAFTTDGGYTVFTTAETHLAGVIFHKSGIAGQSPTISNVNSDTTIEVLYNGSSWSIVGGSSIKVKFKNDYGWSQVYCYAWEGGSQPLGGWPGMQLSLTNGWYTVEIPGGLTNVQFRGATDSEQSTQLLNVTSDVCVGINNCSYTDYVLNGLYTLFTADCNTGTMAGCGSSGGDIKIRWHKGTDVNWTNMGIYEWSLGGGQLCGAWPGIQVAPDGDGWYEYTFTETPENIIFNNFIATTELGSKQVNGPVSQTSDICLEIHPTYYCIANCETGNAPCSELENFIVKWDNAQGWSDMYIYAWIGDEGITELFGAYPGEAVTPINGFYSKTFVKATPVKMIFISPASGAQTSNITGVFSDACYTITSEIEYNELEQPTNVAQLVGNCNYSSVTNLLADGIVIAPNPVKDYLVINSDRGNNSDRSDKFLIEIYDVSGKLHILQLLPISQKINVVDLNPGIYFIKIGNVIKKFVKE